MKTFMKVMFHCMTLILHYTKFNKVDLVPTLLQADSITFEN